MNEFQGTWKRRGLVHVPVIPDEPKSKGGRPRKVTEGAVGRMVDLIDWTPETLREAHAAFERGNRDVYSLAGNREYNRLRMEKARLLSKIDRKWAERDAIRHSWKVSERVNRVSS